MLSAYLTLRAHHTPAESLTSTALLTLRELLTLSAHPTLSEHLALSANLALSAHIVHSSITARDSPIGPSAAAPRIIGKKATTARTGSMSQTNNHSAPQFLASCSENAFKPPVVSSIIHRFLTPSTKMPLSPETSAFHPRNPLCPSHRCRSLNTKYNKCSDMRK